jgi:predicted homoserine dehydrogenase-like protein
MNDQELKLKSLETALKLLEAKLKNDPKVYHIDTVANDTIATAKKFEEYLKG